jgi:predicted protein tyrosine phosphatase
MEVMVFPRKEIENDMAAADALISIRAPGDNSIKIDPTLFDNEIFILEFDDVPVLEWTDDKGRTWHGPTEKQITDVLNFYRDLISRKKIEFIALHCQQGKSRSAAIALTIMADFLGKGREAEAVESVLLHDHEHKLCFNPGIIRMADKILNQGTAIENALELRCQPFKKWKKYWIDKGAIK